MIVFYVHQNVKLVNILIIIVHHVAIKIIEYLIKIIIACARMAIMKNKINVKSVKKSVNYAIQFLLIVFNVKIQILIIMRLNLINKMIAFVMIIMGLT